MGPCAPLPGAPDRPCYSPAAELARIATALSALPPLAPHGPPDGGRRPPSPSAAREGRSRFQPNDAVRHSVADVLNLHLAERRHRSFALVSPKCGAIWLFGASAEKRLVPNRSTPGIAASRRAVSHPLPG
jgi:hypothetical protein